MSELGLLWAALLAAGVIADSLGSIAAVLMAAAVYALAAAFASLSKSLHALDS
jgi:hypothetical protein